MEMKTHKQIKDHLDVLKKQMRMKNKEIAELLGVKPHTFYMYGFEPETRGARKIPVHNLEILRKQAIEKHYEYLDDGFIAPFNIDDKIWRINGIKTRNKLRAIYESAVYGGVIEAAGGNTLSPDLTEDEEIVFKWLRAKTDGSLDAEKMIEISGLDEYEVGCIGYIGSSWGIMPEKIWVDNL